MTSRGGNDSVGSQAMPNSLKWQHDVILNRHRSLLGDLDRKKALHSRPVRSHPRWSELVERQESKATISQSIELDDNFDKLLGPAYVPYESTVRNDFSQRFVDTQTGCMPGNAVGNPRKETRFAEYPKLKQLIKAKADMLDSTSIPPTYLQADLLPSIAGPLPHNSSAFHLTKLLPIKYDVIVIDPPLESYEWETVPNPATEASSCWSWEQVAALPIPQVAAKESFVFLWIGSGASDGLERGREVLSRWGYRRCEDIVWVRTNDEKQRDPTMPSTSSAFHRTAEHCLMGIRGTVRRSLDVRYVHCNIDTDVIIWPGESAAADEVGQTKVSNVDTRKKPPELMDLIENFCLGTRRLELFGCNRNLRRGWLTVGTNVGPDKEDWQQALSGQNACSASIAAIKSEPSRIVVAPVVYEKHIYDANFGIDRPGCTLLQRSNLVPFDVEIERLRPKSPSRQQQDARNTTSPSAVPTGGRHAVNAIGVHSPGTIVPQRFEHGATSQGMYLRHSTATVPVGGIAFGSVMSTPSVVGGAGLSGLGAGGRAVVSIPSGSDTLSGAQASALHNEAVAIAAGAGSSRASPSDVPRSLS